MPCWEVENWPDGSLILFYWLEIPTLSHLELKLQIISFQVLMHSLSKFNPLLEKEFLRHQKRFRETLFPF